MSPQLTPSERAMRSKVAAHARWAKEDPHRQMEIARAGRDKRFLDQVDPDGVLSEEERNRRAKHAFTAHMTRLALKSAQSRRKSRESSGDVMPG